ncbi:hypothetical protein RMATCC62417_18810 [Rhizopus microsporus]|nr:hypothetical protein RMATCC62417_18810 [Rhizopus microsporus]
MGETTRTSKPRKRVVRKVPKRIPVTIQKHNIWNKLAKVDAGLSVSDWLYLDRQAIKDLVDGCRTLRSRRKKIAVKGENIVITAADPKPREPKLRVVPPIVPPGMTHSNMVTAGFGPPQVVGAVDLQDDDGSEWSDMASVSDGSSSTWTTDSDDSLSVNSDEESVSFSVVKYPYSLQSMRTSAPLKGPVSIKGIVVECTFDSGAAVSVMSESLANKLGLEVNGDQMHLTSFDSIPREPCSIVPNVPIRIGGHLRSEHMCILKYLGKIDK